MRHDESTDQARRYTPGGSPDIFEFIVFVLELAVEGSGEILAEEVTRAGLQGFTILHERLDAESFYGAGKPFAGRFTALDHRHGHVIFRQARVDIQNFTGFLERFFFGGVGRMTFLPQELHRSQKQPRPHLPANHVGPLVDQNREVAPRLDPLAVGIPDDGFTRRAHDEVFFQPGVGVRYQATAGFINFEA